MTPPIAYLEPHSSADGMTYWNGSLYVAEWGEYLSHGHGRRVVRFTLSPQGKAGPVTTFVSGLPHPLALTVAPDRSLLARRLAGRDDLQDHSSLGGARRSASARDCARLSSRRRSFEARVGVVARARPLDLQRLRQRLDEPLGRELPVPPLAALVLRDRAQLRPGLRDDAPLLRLGERGRRLDVEDRLDAALRLLRVLAARAARAGEPRARSRSAGSRRIASRE